MIEIQNLVPKSSRLLGRIHDSGFRPSIAPKSERVSRDRVVYEQGGQAIDFATAVRVPICLLSEGDTELLRRIGNPDEGLATLKTITENSPSAAVLFDVIRRIQSNPTVVWFAEDDFFAQTASHAIGVSPETVLPLFQRQADNTVELLAKAVGNKGMKAKVLRLSFSEKKVMEAIVEAISLEAIKLGILSKERKKLKESSAAVVGITHALFPLILSLLSNSSELAVVQGPLHLETNPPNWINNQTLSQVVRFVNQAAEDWNLNHRSLLPCLFQGEPIGEFSIIDDNGPQLRRDQRWKLDQWLRSNPFPLADNAIFGHAIGLIEDKETAQVVENMIAAEKQDNIELGMQINAVLAEKIDQKLQIIHFWK